MHVSEVNAEACMENESLIDPEDVNSTPASDATNASPNPNDEIPVPIVMSPAEIDERAQAFEALGGSPAAPHVDDELQP